MDPQLCARTVWEAWQVGAKLAELPEAARPTTLADGWAAQDALAALAGERLGWKLAATSAAGQAHIAVDAPIPGRLFTRFLRAPGCVLDAGSNLLRVVEAELAFRLGRDATGSADVLDAVDALHLAVEVPDSRLLGFVAAGAAQILADDACAGHFVLGPEVPGWRELDLAAVETEIHLNGELAAAGSGANVLGDPRTVLAWLADELAARGDGLRAGDVVTTGTTTVPVPIGPGDAVDARFPGLGSVALSFA